MAVGIGGVASGPVLHTDRLELRLPAAGDVQAMFGITSDPRTTRLLGRAGGMEDHFTRFLRNAGSWQVYGYGGFILRHHGSDRVIGHCGIFHSWRGMGADFDDSPEAGWIIDAEFAGRGLAREAMDAALHWFEHMHGPRRIVAMIAPGNAASLGLAARLGFTVIREAQPENGDSVMLLERLP